MNWWMCKGFWSGNGRGTSDLLAILMIAFLVASIVFVDTCMEFSAQKL